MQSTQRSLFADLPVRKAPINRLIDPLARFLHTQSASGIFLMVCTACALFLSNSPWADPFLQLWEIPIGITVGSLTFAEPAGLLINDGLMTLFFFVVGLEIKRELVSGELREPRKAALPAVAALGGMVVPALLYHLLQRGQPGQAGWGIPMATDIAFVVGFLALLGKRVPSGLKILLLSLAIVDDLGAVLVIALFYTASVSLAALAWIAVGFALVILLQLLGVRRVSIYYLVGIGIWVAFVKSGIHPTVAGALLGFLTPARPAVNNQALAAGLGAVLPRLQDPAVSDVDARERVEWAWITTESASPLERLELALHPWVAYGIMPLFALANAGVRLEPTAFADPVALAVAAGLVIGKPIGIVVFSALAVLLGLARLPTGVNWRILIGAGCLAGIGFTMSLFIAGLALDGPMLAAAKIGTLSASGLSALLGSGLLLWFLPRDSDK